MRTGKLTVKKIESILAGRDAKRHHGDGGGLWLIVGSRDQKGKPQAASYVYRYLLDGKGREMGLGSAWDVKLGDAREKARQLRERVRNDDVDVLEEKREAKRAKREAAKLAAIKRPTFRQVAEGLVDAKDAGWRNPKSRASWEHTLTAYAYPVLGDLDPAVIDTAMVVSVIEPIWLTKTETATRLRGRIESVLDRAKVLGLRDGENPARWDGHLEHLFPKKSAVAPVEHHAALPYEEIGTFMAELRQQGGIAPRALEYAILTCGRTGAVIGAKRDEIDLAKRIWVVPAGRMKSGKEHRVPLCGRAIEIVEAMDKVREYRPSEFVFQGMREGQPLSNMSLLATLRRMGHPELTAHGFRSTARSWMAAKTNFPREVAEMALAHDVGEAVERSYQRDDMFEKRRQLAEAWCRYCAAPSQSGDNVVSIMGAA
jgi:integrase